VAFLGLGAAEAREHVGAFARAPLRQEVAEEADEPLAPDEPAVELEPRNAQADARHRGGDHVLERPVHLLRAGPELDAHEDRRGDVEREPLVRAERLDLAAVRRPVAEAPLDHRSHALGVVADRRPRERAVHDLPVVLVVVAVPEQEAVREDPAHDRVPRLLRGEDAVLVEEDGAVRLGPEHVHHAELADGVHHDRAVLGVEPAQRRQHVGAAAAAARDHPEGVEEAGPRGRRSL
jgi:hypothetical protein